MNKFSQNSINKELIDKISDDLLEGNRIRQELPFDGYLHIDRPLPFLCLFRRSPDKTDELTSQLISSEASYLITSDSPKVNSMIIKLIKKIVEVLSKKFGAFLIIEIWPAFEMDSEESDFLVPKPNFRIHVSKNKPPTTALETLEKSLKRIKINVNVCAKTFL